MFKNATLLNLLFLLCSYGLWAQADQPVQLLDNYLKENYSNLGLTAADVANYQISSQLISKHNKLSHVYLQQSHDDIPVFNAILNANILPNGEMLSIGNRFVNDLATKINTTTAVITTEQAVMAVINHFRLNESVTLVLDEKVSEREYIYKKEGIALEPVKVHLMYQLLEDESVRLVWNVDLYQLDAQHWWQARIDAVTGEMLDYFDQVIQCNFDHSDDEYCPEDAKYVPHTHHVDTHNSVATTSLTGDDGAAYRVFPLTIESPNHGGRELLVNPADPVASPYGWHDTDGVEGPEYTITRGNTVHAYHDIFDIGESIGDEPDGGDSLCFDYPLDLSTALPYTQLDAATTNLFYWNNLMHDLWFQYGFDEESGNFQQRNYTGEADGSDYVRAEVLDGSGTGNANMATPADGGRPRMQMYLWQGNLPSLAGFQVLAPANLEGVYDFTAASFGGAIPSTPLVAEVVLADDGVGIGSDVCEPIVNGSELTGKVAMIDRGDCEFGFKSLAAQNEGAVAVMICNNVNIAYQNLGGGDFGNQVNIPVIGVERGICDQLKLGLPGLEISLVNDNNAPLIVPMPGPSGLDSDFDNGIIVHEYTHGISNRLTGGRLQAGCLGNTEQAGEGWSDWFGLAMTTTSEDFAEERRGIGTYVLNQNTTGGGIRSFPYSRNMAINPDTYGVVATTTAVHRIGSVWCVMIWDLYWNLVDVYGFDDDLFNGTGGNNIAMQLVMDGLKLQPCNPTFVEARDAIIDADIANNNGANQCLIWGTFARRGLGFSASAGGDESFDEPVSCPPAFRVIKTAVAVADAGDIITYDLEIANGLPSVISEAVVIDELPAGTSLVEGSFDCDITLEDGFLTVNLGDAPPNTIFNCSYQLQTSTSEFSYAAFEDPVQNFTNWESENPIGQAAWQLRVNNTFTGILSIFASDVEEVSDQNLVLLEPVFLEGLNPGLQFYHQYRLENGFDGGVVEISADGGDTWEDVGAENFLENGYNLTLEDSDNPLSGRPAFSDASSDFIRSLVDLSAYAGETVLIRFRLGTDEGGTREGWYIDDITLFANLHAVVNTACTLNNGEPLCDSAVTVLMGELVATENINQDRPLELFPNPTANELTVQLPNMLNEQVELSILSIDGRVLLKQNYNGFLRETLELGTFPAGVYMLQFRTAEGITTRKVIVE